MGEGRDHEPTGGQLGSEANTKSSDFQLSDEDWFAAHPGERRIRAVIPGEFSFAITPPPDHEAIVIVSVISGGLRVRRLAFLRSGRA